MAYCCCLRCFIHRSKTIMQQVTVNGKPLTVCLAIVHTYENAESKYYDPPFIVLNLSKYSGTYYVPVQCLQSPCVSVPSPEGVGYCACLPMVQ